MYKQETQMMLTNPWTGSQVRQGHKIMVPFDMLGMVSYQYALVTLSLIRAVFEIFKLALKLGVRGLSRSSESTRIDPPPMTSY